MADVLFLNDGRIETVFNEQDFLELVDECMGYDARCWLEERLAERDIDDLEKEVDSLCAHHKEVMAELRQESENITGLIREKELDRKALSAAAGNIGCITWREINKDVTGYICDDCEDGMKRGCPHAKGIHYNPWGEGIEPPAWCPQHTDELPF